jgi:hypothetical protein
MAEQNRSYPTRGLCTGKVHVYGDEVMHHRYESQQRFGLSPSPLLDVGWRAWLDGQLRAKALELSA